MNLSYGKQYIDKSDEKFILKSIYDTKITDGKRVKLFENKIKKKLKSKYCISCNSATSGLLLSLKSIGVKKNDIIIMPAVNFIASYSTSTLLGAKIVLCDVDKITGQITPETVENCIKSNKLKKIKALITMYLGGYPNNVHNFFNLKKKYNFFIIEDACHALGATYSYKNKKIFIGSNKHSDISVFSFHPVKPITTGEGGAITTNNAEIYNKLKILRNHGIIRKKEYWNYDIKELSLNFRISDINCALGISQIKKLGKFLKKRRTIYKWYKEFLSHHKYVKLIYFNKEINPSFHLILLNINFNEFKINKDILIKKLNKKKIYPQFHYKPLQTFNFFKGNTNNLKNSIEYAKNTLSIPVFHSLTKNEVKKVVNCIKKILKIN